MKKRIRLTCPMDCFDVCAMIATVEENRVVKIAGDSSHPITRGHICTKGKKLIERQYHPERLTRPRRKINGKWREITWPEAIDEIADRLHHIKNRYGSSAVLHYSDSGYNGVLKSVDSLFFKAYGGVTTPRGSLCWGAGLAAQRYDFGAVRAHSPEDLVNARTILIWGRNPVDTNIHLVPFILSAKKRGAQVILIDPIKTSTARLSDLHISPRPATDAALALGMARIIIENDDMDQAFLKNRTIGFDSFYNQAMAFTPGHVKTITGIEEKQLQLLAKTYARNKPASIFIGYGMQRYQNGGNAVRCIDALGAITGNIGISGGGVNYANKFASRYVSGLEKKYVDFVHDGRTFSMGKLGDFLATAADPPVKCLFVTKANPLVQAPDTNNIKQSFDRIPFKVVIDMFMTDTARHADMVLPCTTVLEEEDIFISPMFSSYIHYSHRAVTPPEGVMSEFDLFKKLARKMEMTAFTDLSREAFLKASIQPLTERFKVDLEQLKEGVFKIPGSDIPWFEEVFSTPSGKYEFYSETAKKDGISPVPVFLQETVPSKRYPLRLITPHFKNSLHSQHFAFTDALPEAYANRKTMETSGLCDGDHATVITKMGRLHVLAKQDDGVGDGIIKIFEGWWHRSGSVNALTGDTISDMGEQAAYYDSWCCIEPLSHEI